MRWDKTAPLSGRNLNQLGAGAALSHGVSQKICDRTKPRERPPGSALLAGLGDGDGPRGAGAHGNGAIVDELEGQPAALEHAGQRLRRLELSRHLMGADVADGVEV